MSAGQTYTVRASSASDGNYNSTTKDATWTVSQVAQTISFGALSAMTYGNAPFAVVIATAAGPAGLAVDGIPRVAVLDEPIAVSELRGGLGTYSIDGAIAVLIDVEAVLLPHTNLGAATLTDGLVNR